MDPNRLTSSYLKDNKFNPSKKLGQNFLIDEQVSNDLVKTIDFNSTNCIVEIGPGLGAITKLLIAHKIPMIAIELDKRLAEYISNKFKDIKVINDDCLRIDYKKITKEYSKPIIVTNLPYSISTLMIITFLKQDKIKTMYCMLQKEVVERIIAKPRTKEYNNFSVLCQFYSSIQKLKFIDKKSFNPVPKVDSMFIVIEKNNKKYDLNFSKFIKVCFLQKRKTLINNLKNLYNTKKITDFLINSGYSPNARAEEIKFSDFEVLYKKYAAV